MPGGLLRRFERPWPRRQPAPDTRSPDERLPRGEPQEMPTITAFRYFIAPEDLRISDAGIKARSPLSEGRSHDGRYNPGAHP